MCRVAGEDHKQREAVEDEGYQVMAPSIREEQKVILIMMVVEEVGTMEVGQDLMVVVVEGLRTCLC